MKHNLRRVGAGGFVLVCLIGWEAAIAPRHAQAQLSSHAEPYAYVTATGHMFEVPPPNPRRTWSWRSLLNVPAFPFALLKRGVDRALVLAEHTWFFLKMRWFFDRITSKGIRPMFAGVDHGSGLGVGLELSHTLWHSSMGPAYLMATVWTKGTVKKYHAHGGQLLWDKLFNGSFFISTQGRYEDRPSEDFFGLGPASSLGGAFTYDQETSAAGLSIGQRLWRTLTWQFTADYAHININEGNDAGKVNLLRGFNESTLPGIDGADLLSFGLSLNHDTRDVPSDPRRGGYTRLGLSYTEGINGADVGFFRYRAEAARFIPVWSNRRTLVVRAVGEVNDEVNNRAIPFYEQTRLGGSSSLRGFQYNRFFDDAGAYLNVEYRYNIWSYKELELETALFFDGGNVFDEISDYQWDDFQSSYGFGVRIKASRRVVLHVDVGHSDDGTELYVHFGSPF